MTEEDEIINLRADKKTLAKMLNNSINFIIKSDCICPPSRIDNCSKLGRPCYDCYVEYFKELA